MIPEEIKGKVIEKIKRTPTIESFRFIPEKKVEFLPGQFLQLILDRKDKELSKYLSFSSSPAREYIEVTKRLSTSKFSEKLKELTPGEEILFKAPFGNCVFKEEYKKIGFLIGGIGITPVISIVEYIIDKKLSDISLVLFYSNRREEEIAFKKELDYWQSLNPNIKIFYIITDCYPESKDCIFGMINKDLLTQITDLKERIIFTFGPPKMVESMKRLCEELGCDKDKVKTEKFIGY
jgi:ferredoxin-NADP reductase